MGGPRHDLSPHSSLLSIPGAPLVAPAPASQWPPTLRSCPSATHGGEPPPNRPDHPTPMLTSGFAGSRLQARKVRPAHPGSPRGPPTSQPHALQLPQHHVPRPQRPRCSPPTPTTSAVLSFCHPHSPPRPGLSHLLGSASTASAGGLSMAPCLAPTLCQALYWGLPETSQAQVR